MQEVALSNDLTQLTTEIKTYQNIGGQAIFEIGRRLKKVKEDDLAHGQFGKWLKSVKMNQNTADRFMKIVNELPNSDTYHNLGWQALYQIATMPEEERDQPHQLDSGEVKKPDEMTVRELLETKQKLKQSEAANKTLDGLLSEKADTIKALNQQIKDKPEPEVVEKTVTKEVKPDDYEDLKQKAETFDGLKKRNDFVEKQIKGLEDKLSQEKLKNDEYQEIKNKLNELNKTKSELIKSINAGAEIISMNKKLKKMFDSELSSVRYKKLFYDDPDYSIVDETRSLIDTLQAFVDDMNSILPTNERKIIEGKFTE